MATGIYSWSQTAATNATADSTINWAEGQAPSTINDSSRAAMAVIAKWRDDISGVQPSNAVQTSGGSANAQTLVSNLSIAALTNGWTLTFKAGATNTAACTLQVDGLVAKAIQRISGTALIGGEIVAGYVYTVTYHQPTDSWVLQTGAITPLAGSWTPVLTFGGGTTGITYGTQVGRYVLAAPLVTVWAKIILTSNGTSTGSATITGLPFTASNVTGLDYTGDCHWDDVNAVSSVTASIQPNTAIIDLYKGNTGDDGTVALTEARVADTFMLSLTLTYRTG